MPTLPSIFSARLTILSFFRLRTAPGSMVHNLGRGVRGGLSANATIFIRALCRPSLAGSITQPTSAWIDRRVPLCPLVICPSWPASLASLTEIAVAHLELSFESQSQTFWPGPGFQPKLAFVIREAQNSELAGQPNPSRLAVVIHGPEFNHTLKFGRQPACRWATFQLLWRISDVLQVLPLSDLTTDLLYTQDCFCTLAWGNAIMRKGDKKTSSTRLRLAVNDCA
ncbi:hypothetical protein DFH08DRAFT_800246 [Mycena albidolilacea]|uniref:Uncharacterized protein n=1 Tax=Mycena albidolilacea TaxID=1033008 RepID=A0AAD7AJJ8_9AGAR|nr:hypothetical protein DFH08DRAFT_800246 [Mycena albidolilacea]